MTGVVFRFVRRCAHPRSMSIPKGKNMVFNALRAARMRGERVGEHARAAVVNAGGGDMRP